MWFVAGFFFRLCCAFDRYRVWARIWGVGAGPTRGVGGGNGGAVDRMGRTFQRPTIHHNTRTTLCFATTLLFTEDQIVNKATPFTVTLVSISGHGGCFCDTTNTTLNYLLFVPRCFTECTTTTIVIFLKTLTLSFTRTGDGPLLPVTVYFFTLLTAKLIASVGAKNNATSFTLATTRDVLNTNDTFFFCQTLGYGLGELEFGSLPLSSAIYVMVSTTLLLVDLSRARVFNVSPTHTLTTTTILVVIQCSSRLSNLVLTLTTNFTLSLRDTSSLFLAKTCKFSTLLKYLFYRFNAPTATNTFALSFTLFGITFNTSTSCFTRTTVNYNTITILPEILDRGVHSFFRSNTSVAPSNSLHRDLIVQLEFTSNTVDYVDRDMGRIHRQVGSVGRHSSRTDHTSFDPRRCQAHRVVGRGAGRVHHITTSRFFSVSSVLTSLTARFSRTRRFSGVTTKGVEQVLDRCRVCPHGVSIVRSGFNEVHVRVLATNNRTGFGDGSLRATVSGTYNECFSGYATARFDRCSVVAFARGPGFDLRVNFTRRDTRNELYNSYVETIGSNGNHDILVVDSNVNGNNETTLSNTVKTNLLSGLLATNFNFSDTLGIIGSTLLIGSGSRDLTALSYSYVSLFANGASVFGTKTPPACVTGGNGVAGYRLSSVPTNVLHKVRFTGHATILNRNSLLLVIDSNVASPNKD